MSRAPVRKTYKLFIGGAFPRSESGRTFELDGHNVARASRKDARDAVVAARKGFAAWSAATVYNPMYLLAAGVWMEKDPLAGGAAVDVRRLGQQFHPVQSGLSCRGRQGVGVRFGREGGRQGLELYLGFDG